MESDKNRLTVHAKKSEKKDGMSRLSEYCRTVYLPDKVDDEKFTSHLSKVSVMFMTSVSVSGNFGIRVGVSVFVCVGVCVGVGVV